MGENKIYQILAQKDGGPKIYLRDSWLLMQGKLADLPKTFNLDVLAKLYFPHKFNIEENFGRYLPCLPPIEDYFPKAMKPEDYKKFKQWYNFY